MAIEWTCICDGCGVRRPSGATYPTLSSVAFSAPNLGPTTMLHVCSEACVSKVAEKLAATMTTSLREYAAKLSEKERIERINAPKRGFE